MQKLDHRRELHPSLAVCRAGIRGQQHHQGAKAFAAGFHQVLTNFFHEVNIGGELAGNEGVNGGEVVEDRSVERKGGRRPRGGGD